MDGRRPSLGRPSPASAASNTNAEPRPRHQDYYLSYLPHGGHTDQMRELVLAAALARRLSRVLVLPSLLPWPLPQSLRHLLFSHTCSADPFAAWNCSRDRPLESFLDTRALGVRFLEDTQQLRALGHRDNARTQATVVDPAWVSLGPRQQRRASTEPTLLHFSSMLFGVDRRGGSHTCRIANLEKLLSPAACHVRYRGDLLERAREMLTQVMGVSFVAVHVRTAAEAAGKRELQHEWTARLASLLRDDSTADVAAVYLASDSLTSALPLAARLAAQAPRRADQPPLHVLSHRNFSSSLPRIHNDPALARLLLDIFAATHAASFSPSTRSGLSMHMVAVRGCARTNRCVPATRGIAESSSGCGGDLPPHVQIAERRGASSSTRASART
jgi:hypothetical protein